MSDTSKVQVLIRREDAWGEDPAAKAMTEILINSESLTPGKSTVKSAAIRADRQKDAILKVGESASGNVTANLSEAFLNAFGVGLFQAEKVTATKSGTLTAATKKLTLATDDDFNALKGANVILIAGAVNAANNGRKLVTAIDAATKTITLDAVAADEAAVNASVNYFRNGALTPIPSFAIEKGFQDAAESGFHCATGLRVNTAQFNFQARQIATADMAFLGREYLVGDESVASAVTPAAADEPLSTSANFGALKDGDEELADALSEFSFSISNNMRERPQVGSVFSADHGTGDFAVTGNLTAYFGTGALLKKCLAHQTASLSAQANTDSGKVLFVSLPKVHLLTDEVPITGENADVMENISFEALRDATKGYTLQIDIV